jgi:hypothetical protein
MKNWFSVCKRTYLD